MKYGIVFRPHSFWVGIHYSKHNKRFCINIIPFITIWIVKPGGLTPHQSNDLRSHYGEIKSYGTITGRLQG
jgi:hypothetical protein